jgi:hypothetical protein
MPRQTFYFIISCKARGYPTLISHRSTFCLPEPPSYLPKPPLSPQAPLLSPRALFLSTRAKRGVPRLLRTLGLRWQVVAPSASEGSPPGDAVPKDVRDTSLSLSRTGWRGMTGWRMSPRAPFLCLPEASAEGSPLESPVFL